MSKLTLHDYLKSHRIPNKIICIDSKTTYHQIPFHVTNLPVCANMVVDHIEIDPLNSDDVVVFVLAPDGMMWR